MSKYKQSDFSYGVELEFSSVSILNKLPEGAVWNKQDYSIVNNNGIANDPSGKFYKFGGEINTKPTNTIEEQVQHIQDIIAILDPKPEINYKCNLHIHIRVPGLKDDLETCKKVMKYIHDFGKQAFDIVDPLIIPTKELYPDREELEAAIKRYKRNQDSHQYLLEESKYKKIMESTNLHDFYYNHVLISQRPGINMRPMFDNNGNGTNTIEFRHFFGTLNMNEYKSCLTWCSEFLNATLNTGEEPKDIIKRNTWMIFPKARRFDLRLQKGFEKTSIEKKFKNSEEDIRRNIDYILHSGSFTNEETSTIIKEHTISKRKSLFEG